MINTKLLWQGDDFIDKIENVAEKIVDIMIVAFLIYVILLA